MALWKIVAAVIAGLLVLTVSTLYYYRSIPIRAVLGGNSGMNDGLSENRPEYVALGQFRANLSGGDGDQHLKTEISLKVNGPGLGARVSATTPELRHHVNMIIESCQASELATYEGKMDLARKIKAETESIVGLKPDPASISGNGIAEVLFTSFFIQR